MSNSGLETTQKPVVQHAAKNFPASDGRGTQNKTNNKKNNKMTLKPDTTKSLIEYLGLSPVIIFRFRGQTIEKIEYIDKKTKTKEVFHKHTLSCEYDNGTQLLVELEYPRGVEPEKVKYERDQYVFGVVTNMLRSTTGTVVRVGLHYPIEVK